MSDKENFDWLKYAREQRHKSAELRMEADKAQANAEYGEAMFKSQQYGSKPSSAPTSAPSSATTPPPAADTTPRCADCGQEIKGSSDGRYSAQKRAEWSVRDYGNIYCYKCKDKHQKRS